ncbi:MAG TPA: hypothetical protein VKB73_04420 [Gaiellaceae bacterium]|nr:hypothetical protein [Gaiellaceae bacterium]
MRTEDCIALSDDELLDATYDAVCKVAELDEDLAEKLSSLVGEWSERFAPEAARAELVRLHKGLAALRLVRDALAEDKLHDDLEGLRQRQAARQLRDTLDRR